LPHQASSLPWRSWPECGLRCIGRRSWTLNMPWHACFVAELPSIILHHAPGPATSAPPPPATPSCSFARRVHVEPRPPDFEESSEFSRALAGKDGIRQGGNVPSPPPPLHCTERALTMPKIRRCARDWRRTDWSGSRKATPPDCMLGRAIGGGATAKQLRTAPHG
jgi:hypothetical protein